MVHVGRRHWCICKTHRVKWLVGENLASAWRDMTEDDWRANAAELSHYKEVAGIYPQEKASEQPTGLLVEEEDLQF